MTTSRKSANKTVLMAVVVLFAMIATACGSGLAQLASDQEEAAVAGPVEGPALQARPVQQGPALPNQPIEAAPTQPGGHQFGVNLAEWTEITQATSGGSGSNAAELSSEFGLIEWPDLIPPGLSGEEIYARYEERFDAVEVGSEEGNQLYEEMIAEFDPDAVNGQLDGQKIRLAGFVAPLTYEGDTVVEFLLVPTFGACVHVPAPPPNQTVLVTLAEGAGMSIDDTWGAIWVEGTMAIDSSVTDLATASYTITSAASTVYEV